MPTTIRLDPVTRIEGHLEIEVTVDDVGGELQVIDAKSAGTMFRGFEIIMAGRDPRDAVPYSQRICGVCPVSHAMAACLSLEDAFDISPPQNGRILRNLVLGANFIQSHVLHFYHLGVLDYIDTTGALDVAPWTPRYVTPDMIDGSLASEFINHYIAALEIRRKAHQMGAIFAGKIPCIASFVVGGCTESATAESVQDFRALLTEIRAFIDNTYIPDASLLAERFGAYYGFGTGSGNLLAYGAFDLDPTGANRLFESGRYTQGALVPFDPSEITEHVKYSWYTHGSGNLNPADGMTEPEPDKPDAYSWTKAPRYENQVYELGPLARMWINQEYTHGISAMDRTMARAFETKKIADAMDGWLDELVVGEPTYTESSVPQEATAVGLTEAPRGGLGHWMDIEDSLVKRYQIVTPTAWNASPKDDLDQMGPIESALIETPVLDIDQPVEVLRVVHSFDPCLACAVHMVRPNESAKRKRIVSQPAGG